MRHVLLLLLLSLFVFSLYSTILTVDNRTPSGGQFSTFDAAYTAATEGDSIHLFPSPISYSVTSSISKQLHIFGGGFEYSNQLSGPNLTQVSSSLLFSLGSASSSLSGVKVNGMVTLNDDDIDVYNCHIVQLLTIDGNISTIEETKLSSILIMPGCINTFITKCYVYSHTSSTYSGVRVEHSNTAVIYNNIIDVDASIYASSYGIHISSVCEILLSGNYIGITNSHSNETALYTLSEITAINNIFYEDVVAGEYNYFSYNILSSSYTNLPPTNIGSVDVPALFIDWANNDFHLAPGSLALGAGEGGIDCGPYGGASPFNDNYYLSPLPSILELQAPTVVVPAEGPMQVEIRASTLGN